jgi:hypothetical protein
MESESLVFGERNDVAFGDRAIPIQGNPGLDQITSRELDQHKLPKSGLGMFGYFYAQNLPCEGAGLLYRRIEQVSCNDQNGDQYKQAPQAKLLPPSRFQRRFHWDLSPNQLSEFR